MKKLIILLSAAFLAITFMSCTNDKYKGERDGKAYCNCLKKADINIYKISECAGKYANNLHKKSAEYQESFNIAMSKCTADIHPSNTDK
ncbi:MAG: hypothetical protein LBC49_03165 [Bacteroidales bacterium]|jgi:hypothetical protein|nr:hypothetical protein [Bacteroidales bacterium]